MGSRELGFSRVVYIDRQDFREEANKKYKRLVLGGEVRLRYGYVIRANEIVRDAAGLVIEVRCTYDPDTLGRNPEGRKVRGVIHWVSAKHSVPAEIRLYEPLFTVDFPDADERDYQKLMNPESLEIRQGLVEAGLADAGRDDRFQFEREGYFCPDSKDSMAGALVFNRIVTLRDSWAKIEQAVS